MRFTKNGADLYDFPCEYCEGRVGRRIVKRELIQVRKSGYIALENVPIGVCSRCSAHYYSASVLHQAEDLHRHGARRQVQVPVATYVRAG